MAKACYGKSSNTMKIHESQVSGSHHQGITFIPQSTNPVDLNYRVAIEL